MASWNVDVKCVFIPNWIHLDPLPCARKVVWLRSHCARRKNSGSDSKKNGAVRIRSRVHRALVG